MNNIYKHIFAYMKKQYNQFLIQARLNEETHKAFKEKVKKEFTNIADVLRKLVHQYLQR
jgi:DnaJ-domain-containing protein 1